MSLTALARNLALDGRFSSADATELLQEAGRADPTEAAEQVRELLRDPDFTATLDPGARRLVNDFLSVAAPASDALGQLPDGTKIFLREGCFLPDPNAELPRTPQDYGQLLYRAAKLFAEPGLQDPVAGLDVLAKEKVLERVLVGLSQARPDAGSLAYDHPIQAGQQRSASATVLRSIFESLDGATGSGRLLQDRVLTTLLDMIKAETNPGLQDHMAFHLHAMKDKAATGSDRARIEEAFEAFAPTKPPYDEWFANGNRQLNVVCHTGSEFFKSEIELWKRDGFTVVEEGQGYGAPTVLEKTMRGDDGQEMKVRLKMMSGKGGTFDDMDDSDTHIVAYSGHSSWGKNMPSELDRAPDAQGPTKVVLIHQCCGQGIINRFRDKYDEAHLVTTRYSSYESEDHMAFSKVLEGVADRSSWDSIHDSIADERWNNRRNNYITPADEFTRMKTLDQDHDGKADVADRLYDFDTFDVPGDTATAFTPREPSRRDQVLSGDRAHNASQIVNTTLGFSHYLDHISRENAFVGGGHFDPKPGDADRDRMIRLSPRDVDLDDMGLDHDRANLWSADVTLYDVQLNRRFAHASEEVVKAATFYEVGMAFGDASDPAEKALQSLILVAHSLNVDDAFGRDEEIFNNLRDMHGLPKELTFADARRYLNADSHVYAGADVGVRNWKTSLGPGVMADLARAVNA
jgi:hypothetical protein